MLRGGFWWRCTLHWVPSISFWFCMLRGNTVRWTCVSEYLQDIVRVTGLRSWRPGTGSHQGRSTTPVATATRSTTATAVLPALWRAGVLPAPPDPHRRSHSRSLPPPPSCHVLPVHRDVTLRSRHAGWCKLSSLVYIAPTELNWSKPVDPVTTSANWPCAQSSITSHDILCADWL